MGIFSWLKDLFGGSAVETAEVEIIAKPRVNGLIQWDIDVKGKYKDGKKIKVPYAEACEIHFDLNDGSGEKLRFDASAPMFVKNDPNDPCPTTFASDQLMVDSCKADKLVVLNWNGKKEELRYQLNFVTKGGAKVNSFDPIIDNGGGFVRPPTF